MADTATLTTTTAHPSPSPLRETAVVLGAGGAAGWSFHVGVADALADAGLSLGSVGRVIGVSAGAAISATLLAGTDRERTFEHLLIPPPPEERERALEALRQRRSPPWRLFIPTSRSLLRHALPWRWSPGLAATALIPRGVLPTRPLRLFPGLIGSNWPSSLWIPAIRLPDGERVVFGRDAAASLPDAVEASQSVPMMFDPKVIDGHRHIDAATVSSTHADLLLGTGIRRAVIAAPMLRPGSGIWRGIVRRAFEREREALEAEGIVVDVIAPGKEFDGLFSGIRGRGPSVAPLLRERARELAGGVLERAPQVA